MDVRLGVRSRVLRLPSDRAPASILLVRKSMWLAPVFLLDVLFATPRARADGGENLRTCTDAAENGQQSRDEGKFRAAYQAFTACGQQECPGIIKADCVRWLSELEKMLPTVVVIARDAVGRDMDGRILMDGALLAERLDGNPIIVDGGSHVFRFEAKDGAAAEERVIIHAAEKNRILDIRLGTTAQKPSTDSSKADSDNASGDRARVSPLAWILGGVGILGMGGFAYFGLSANAQLSDLRAQPCAASATCAEADLDQVKTKHIVADISLGVGVVALGAAVWLLVSGSASSSNPRPRSALDFRTTPLATGGATERAVRF